jgi:hypothetical protein
MDKGLGPTVYTTCPHWTPITIGFQLLWCLVQLKNALGSFSGQKLGMFQGTESVTVAAVTF